jgi:hypothetical protein
MRSLNGASDDHWRTVYGADPFNNPNHFVVRRAAGVAIQQRLGLWTKRRTRSARAYLDHPTAAASVLS